MSKNGGDGNNASDPEEQESNEPKTKEEIVVITPALSAGVIVEKELKKKDGTPQGSRKFLRLQNKISNKQEARSNLLQKRKSKFETKETSLDRALRLSNISKTNSLPCNATAVPKKEKDKETKTKTKTNIKIAGTVNGLTPMEIARQNKSGLDALF